MKKYIALTLLFVMIFALAACGKSEAPAPAQAEAPAQAQEAAPAEQAEPAAPADAQEAAPAEQPAEQAAPAAQGIEPNSGVYKFSDPESRIHFDFDSKYAAMRNPGGNVTVFAGADEGMNICHVSVLDKETAGDAVSYLKGMAESAVTELGKNLKAQAGDPQKIDYLGREIYYISYVYASKEAGGNVRTAYYAENLPSGEVAVYDSNALEGQTADVDAILKLALETFSIDK
ncbi:MAG: hypothetical protein IKS25_06860 [Oscillospiraceae bacterium]|nr:hypothetical protein [Oscillospiraceae bacterium]